MMSVGPGIRPCCSQQGGGAPAARRVHVEGDSWTAPNVWSWPLWYDIASNNTISSTGVSGSVIQTVPSDPTISVRDRILASDLTDVRKLVVMAGVNDVSSDYNNVPTPPSVILAAMQQGVQDIKAYAAAQGVDRVLFFTAQPFKGATVPAHGWTAAKEAIRQDYNAWLLSTFGADAINLDAIIDLNGDGAIDAAFDYGDGVHLNAAGNAQVANAVTALIA